MAKKDSYDADKEDDKGKHLNRKKGKRTRKSVSPGRKFRKKLIDSVSMEEEAFFRIEDNMGGDNDPEVIISIVAEKIGQKNSGSEAQDKMEVATSNGFDDDCDEWQQFCDFNYESTDSSDSDLI